MPVSVRRDARPPPGPGAARPHGSSIRPIETQTDSLIEEFQATRPWPLDPFQVEAITKLDTHRGVLVSAPTSSGKTVVADYCSFRGLFAVGGNETTPNVDNNAVLGQPQSGIWFGKTDDLWGWGKPQGWGGPWRNDMVTAGKPSDPFLFTGFDHKVLHLIAEKAASIEIEVDFLGNGTWAKYETVKLIGGEYRPVIFPEGFSAHWCRLIPSASCKMTAEFIFT